MENSILKQRVTSLEEQIRLQKEQIESLQTKILILYEAMFDSTTETESDSDDEYVEKVQFNHHK